MRRLAAIPVLLLVLAGCGGKTTTVITTVTPTTTTQASGGQDAILDAAVAFYAATGDTSIDRNQLKVVKANGTFADVLVAQEAHAILKKAADRWIVVFDGNGSIPPETRSRFGIPPDYGG